MYADFADITKLNIHEYQKFPKSTKISTHENKWINSSFHCSCIYSLRVLQYIEPFFVYRLTLIANSILRYSS